MADLERAVHAIPMTKDGAQIKGVAGAAVRGIAGIVLIAHGLIHLLGPVLLWHWGQPGTLSTPTSSRKPVRSQAS